MPLIRPTARWVLSLGASLFIAGAACQSAPPPAPTAEPAKPAAAAPTAAPSATAAIAKPAGSPLPAASPTAVAASSVASPAASPAAKPAGNPAANPVAAGGTTWTLVSGDTEARFRAREQLAQRPLPNDAIGATKEVTGQIVVGSDGQVVADQSKVTINMASFRSDSGQRDNFIRQNTLRVNQFPTSEFTIRELRGLPNPLPTSGEHTFQVVGDFKLRNATQPLVWETTANFSPTEVTGTATSTVKLEDFGIERPRVPVVLSIEENIRLELDFKARGA